jgi:hypothetical protein
MLHADFHLGPHFRIFSQLKSGLEDGRDGGPRPTDRDKFDAHQAFMDVSVDIGDSRSLTLRAGRQEMDYGSSRLISVRDGPNVRQSFDGVKLALDASVWRVDGFIVRPVETNEGVFDDKPDPERFLWGIYGVAPLPVVPGGKVDLYFLTSLSSIGKKQNSLKERQTSSETQRECEFGAKNNRWTIILNLSFNGVALEEVISGRGWSPPIPATLSGTCHCSHGSV